MANKRATKKAKKKSNKLDYSLVPEPEFTPTFRHLPKELEEAMRPCPRTLERMQAALSSTRGMDSIKPEGDHSKSKAESAFRSALIDYVSIEDILKRELTRGATSVQAVWYIESFTSYPEATAKLAGSSCSQQDVGTSYFPTFEERTRRGAGGSHRLDNQRSY